MLQLTGDFYQDADSVLTGPAVQLGVTGEDVHMAGSILGTCRAEKLNQNTEALYGESSAPHSAALYDGHYTRHEDHISHSAGTGSFL